MSFEHLKTGLLTHQEWYSGLLHPETFAYLTRMSIETALHQLIRKVENILENKELLGPFLNIEGVLENTFSLAQLLDLSRIKQLGKSVVFGLVPAGGKSARSSCWRRGVGGSGVPQRNLPFQFLQNLVQGGFLKILISKRHSTLGHLAR